MKIDKLIEQLEYISGNEVGLDYCEPVHQAAEIIKVLWVIAQDTTNANYKRQIDEILMK